MVGSNSQDVRASVFSYQILFTSLRLPPSGFSSLYIVLFLGQTCLVYEFCSIDSLIIHAASIHQRYPKKTVAEAGLT